VNETKKRISSTTKPMPVLKAADFLEAFLNFFTPVIILISYMQSAFSFSATYSKLSTCRVSSTTKPMPVLKAADYNHIWKAI
jgi:hypothetical protein